MNRAVAVAVAIVGLAGGRMARVVAASERPQDGVEPPYAPSPSAAPFVALGYRELAADLLYVRMVGYFGGMESSAPTNMLLAETITTLDPRFRRAYELGAVAATSSPHGVDNAVSLRAIELLRKASEVYPQSYRYPMLAGQIYLVDLKTTDRAQRRAWDEKGSLLLDSAARKPNAPVDAAMTAASIRTRFGQRERAVESLRELLLMTSDIGARKRIIDRIAELAGQNADEIAAELLEARRTFERTWKDTRPSMPATMFILVGAPLAPAFDLGDLATGGRDLIGTSAYERLEPLVDEPPAPAPSTTP